MAFLQIIKIVLILMFTFAFFFVIAGAISTSGIITFFVLVGGVLATIPLAACIKYLAKG